MDDKTALSKDVDVTAVTSDASQNEIKKPSSEPAKQKASFSFFGVSDGGNTGKLKYITNTVNESVVEDDPAFVKEKIKYGKSPIIKTKQRNGGTIILIVSIIAAAVFIGGIVFALSFHSPERLSRLLSLGDKYLAELDYENAAKAYRSALAIDGENEHAYIGLTKSYMGLKDYDKALETVDMAITVLGRNDELVELRRRIFVERCGEKGLYLDGGTFVPDGGSCTLTDIKDAFLYLGTDEVVFSGLLYNEANKPFTKEKTKLRIKGDTILPFDGNIHAYKLITEYSLLHGGSSCWLVDHIKDENGNSGEYKYHISYSDAEVATATEELKINKDELVGYFVKYEEDGSEEENTSEDSNSTDDSLNKKTVKGYIDIIKSIDGNRNYFNLVYVRDTDFPQLAVLPGETMEGIGFLPQCGVQLYQADEYGEVKLLADFQEVMDTGTRGPGWYYEKEDKVVRPFSYYGEDSFVNTFTVFSADGKEIAYFESEEEFNKYEPAARKQFEDGMYSKEDILKYLNQYME